jgi:hypothetical protein
VEEQVPIQFFQSVIAIQLAVTRAALPGPFLLTSPEDLA